MPFSKTFGFAKPKLAQVESLDEAARIGLWEAFEQLVLLVAGRRNHFRDGQRVDVQRLWIEGIWSEILKKRRSELHSPQSQLDRAFFSAPWHTALDIIEAGASLLGKDGHGDYTSECNRILERENSAYRFVGESLAPLVSETDVQAVEETITALEGLPAARAHLAHAVHLLAKRPNPDYRNSVKESISAVEAVAQWVTQDQKATLGAAVSKIPGLHVALSKSLSALYGWTSDANGIRHALQDEPTLTIDDARFMLVTCSAFCSYLIAKVPTPS